MADDRSSAVEGLECASFFALLGLEGCLVLGLTQVEFTHIGRNILPSEGGVVSLLVSVQRRRG